MTAEPILSATHEDKTPAESELRKQKFARVIKARAKLGYEIESQTETSAVLVTKGPKRMFGMRGGLEQRIEVTLDDRGAASNRSL
jgi:hypothetical protein